MAIILNTPEDVSTVNSNRVPVLPTGDNPTVKVNETTRKHVPYPPAALGNYGVQTPLG